MRGSRAAVRSEGSTIEEARAAAVGGRVRRAPAAPVTRLRARGDAVPESTPAIENAPDELDPALCYRILLTRDRRFDGRFFVAVVTTGVYCRPICPVPPPRPWNVRFYACAAAAEAAGFRPCKRCRPETSPGTPAWMGSSAIVARALRLLAMPPSAATSASASHRSTGKNAAPTAQGDSVNVRALAERLGVGERHLRRLFVAHLGAPPGAIARANRVHLARRLLDETDWKIADVAFAAGFESVRQFNHAIRTTFGLPPRTLRGRGRAGARGPRERRAATPEPTGRPGAITLRLPYRPPFDWPALRDFLAVRAIPGVEAVAADAYRRTIALPEADGTLTLRPVDERCHVLLTLDLTEHRGHGATEGAGPLGSIAHVVARARRLLDLDADPARISADLGRSAPLTRAVERRPGLRVPGAWDPFELAVRAILGQQVTVRGATSLAGRLVERFGTPLEASGQPPAASLTHLFPSPARLRDADLGAIGMPGARAATIRRLAAAVDDGSLALDDGASLEAIVARLVALPGIGDWTAHYIAMRAFGEPDAFPAGDLGLRRALGRAEGNSKLTSAAVAAIAEEWHPWRAYAAMHLWLSEQTRKNERE